MENVIGIILAAGHSTRIKSNFQKIIHEVVGKPMIKYIIETLEKIPLKRNLVIVSEEGKAPAQKVLQRNSSVDFIIQKRRLGTGHAVLQTASRLKNFSGVILVLCGDTPLLTVQTLRRLIKKHKAKRAAATVLTTEISNPTGYGRIILDSEERIEKIVEDKDLAPGEAKIKEINAGTYCFDSRTLFKALKKVTSHNKQEEYYLTDVIEILVAQGLPVERLAILDSTEVLGVNTRKQLTQAQRVLRYRILDQLMERGITIIDPDNTFIDSGVTIGMDTTIYPFTFIRGKTSIGHGCQIGPQSHIKDAKIGNQVKILMSIIEESEIKARVSIGPFSHVRGRSFVEDGSIVENLVEINNSRIGRGSRIRHFSYISDCLLKGNVEIGAGTIISNLDAGTKLKTLIEKDVIIGSHANISGPVKVKKGIYPGFAEKNQQPLTKRRK
ncbi:MAG: bifunctional UDP-N-acetylglucosamine diphosphorylase/glucosamine-1-phosphate N-acetyltransferase GlmU [Candidatus Ratteibacteria bacterium]|nr:bifunctional UDP-N-acetylglucosamine diphosphorylase/glucosamine-1-phosphate N-acetyltransferase GlmU [Candidatus Ratteibacteria bacterium]